MNVANASLNHHVWLGFYVRWPAILSVDYRGIFANWQIRLEFRAPKMEHSFEFGDSRLHEFLNCFACAHRWHLYEEMTIDYKVCLYAKWLPLLLTK